MKKKDFGFWISDFGFCPDRMRAGMPHRSGSDEAGTSEILFKLFATAVLLARIGLAAVDFDRDVHPILAARCFTCHSGDKRSGGLSLSNYSEILRGGKTGKVVNPGSSQDSLMMRRVLGEGVAPMPPVGERLASSEIAVLRSWIDEGARPRLDAAPARANWVPKMALTKPVEYTGSVSAGLFRPPRGPAA